VKNVVTSTPFDFPLFIEHVNLTQGQGGFVRSREHLVDYFLHNESEYTHWIHLDDDMLVGYDHSLTRALEDYVNNVVDVGGLLVLFLNSWSRPSIPLVNYGPLQKIKYVGAPAFVISRTTINRIGGNPYTTCRTKRKNGCPDGEAANAWFWNKLKKYNMSLLSNTNQAYSLQHLANSHSLIFGRQPSWENLWATNRNSNSNKKQRQKTLVTVPPYELKQVQHAVRPIAGAKHASTVKLHSKLGHNEDLMRYVLMMNGGKGTGSIRFPFEMIEELKEDLFPELEN